MSDHPEVQVANAYRRMAAEALYRPAAPSDGLGTITVPLAELDLDEEAAGYAAGWWAVEGHGDGGEHYIGTCDYDTRSATIFAVEACRQMCAGLFGREVALRLLKMAVADLEGTE